eukprot:286573-Chlamydomonas_euryale.AAC.1
MHRNCMHVCELSTTGIAPCLLRKEPSFALPAAPGAHPRNTSPKEPRPMHSSRSYCAELVEGGARGA